MKIPETIEVVEAVSEYISSYRKSDKLIVTDGRNLAYLPANEDHHFTDSAQDSCVPVNRRI